MIRTTLKRLFDLRDGEIYISFLMQLYVFILITILLMVKPTINALFLSQLGASVLPYGYLLVAITAMVSSIFYNKALQKVSLKKIIQTTLTFFSVIFFLLSLVLFVSTTPKGLLYFYYISVALFGVLVTSQFWILANMIYNAREAKRLFGFIGVGAIAGGIFGGYLTTALAINFGNKTVILIAALLTLICMPILQLIWKERANKMNNYVRKQRLNRESNTYRNSFRIVLNSKHLLYLALITGIGVVVAKLVDFQFSDFAHRAFKNSDSLASFFGFWFSTFNVIALLIQLFLTNKLLNYFGVTANLLILPLGIAIGSLLFLTFPELWVLIIIKGVDGSFKQSVNKAAVELSILPIPQHLKQQAKSFIDVVVDSVATGIAGFLLIFLVRKLNLNTTYITVIILLLLFGWIVLIYRLREAYFESFKKNIKRSLGTEEALKKALSKESIIKSATKILNSENEEEIIALLERLKDYKAKSLQPHIIKLLDYSSNKVKILAIKHLYNFSPNTAIRKVIPLINVKNDELVFTAMEYLMNHTRIDEEQMFRAYLDHESDYIANAALLCLAKESFDNHKIGAKFSLHERVDKKIAALTSEEGFNRKQEIAELLTTLGYAGIEKHYSFIHVHLNNKKKYIVKHAIKAAGLTRDEQFIKTLFRFLPKKGFRKHAVRALKNYGQSITSTILKLEANGLIDDQTRRFVPKVIESFKTKSSLQLLLKLARSNDVIIRYEVAQSLNKLLRKTALKIDDKYLNRFILRECNYYKTTLTAIIYYKEWFENNELVEEDASDIATERQIARELLFSVLEDEAQISLQNIFKFLRLKYSKKDIDIAYTGFLSEQKDTQMNAIEYLDNLLHIRLKGTLLPLLEYYVIKNSSVDLIPNFIPFTTEKECLTKLLRSNGKNIKLNVLYLIQNLEDKSYVKYIKPLQRHTNKDIRSFAEKAIKKLYSK